ncbi:MAG TPA: hypothetical protein VGN57_18975 [Pirellulaceae bacterium]|jgi:hypothetical protein|nr:hypothetical protein [Pirellulaceae bacterium]
MSYARISIVGTVTVHLNVNLRSGSNFYSVTNIKELLSALGTRRSETPKQGDHGVEGSLSYYGPRFLPFEGEIHGTSVAQRITLEQNLRKCLALPRSQSLTGNDGYKLIQITTEDGLSLQTYAKIIDMPEFTLFAEGKSTLSRFRFAMIAEDPFLYAQSLSETTGPEASYSSTFTLQDGSLMALQDGNLPALQESLVYGLSVENEGTTGTPPVITIYGPTADPVVTNETTGKTMDLTGLTLLADERVEIDTASYSITKFDSSDVETDVSAYLSSDSQWIFLEPGVNELNLLDSTPGTLEAEITVSFRNAYV